MFTFLDDRFIKKIRIRIDSNVIHLPTHLQGTWGVPISSKRYQLKKLLKKIISTILYIHVFFIGFIALVCFLLNFFEPAATPIMIYRKYLYHWDLKPQKNIASKNIPNVYTKMLVSVEDGDFYNHFGISLTALKDAYNRNKKSDEILFGGSTLTMQLARTLFLIPEKWYIRKYLEIIIALEMDKLISKERQLYLYFNYAEWGKGIFGVETACFNYYKFSFNKIGREGAIRLITLLASPILYTPSTIFKSYSLKVRYNYLYRKYIG